LIPAPASPPWSPVWLSVLPDLPPRRERQRVDSPSARPRPVAASASEWSVLNP
jgi:hypothetical protein